MLAKQQTHSAFGQGVIKVPPLVLNYGRRLWARASNGSLPT